jgi:hypothetical protein
MGKEATFLSKSRFNADKKRVSSISKLQ